MKMEGDLSSSDRRLISALKANARASVTELSASLEMSRTTVKQRLDRLVAEGFIQRFTIETTVEEKGVRAISSIELRGSMSREVIRALHSLPEVRAVYSTNGKWDLVAEVGAADLPGLDYALRRMREIRGVLNSETSLLLAAV